MSQTARLIPALLLAGGLLLPSIVHAEELQLPTARPYLELTGTAEFTSPSTAPSWQKSNHAEPVKAELTIEERRKIQARLKLRRKLVPVHQTLAFVAAGTIVAAEVFGLVNSIALKTGQPTRDELEPNLAIHRVLAGVGTGAYLGAGIVAWTMPAAFLSGPKAADTSVKKGVDSGKLHIALSVLHGVAMGTVVATGILQANVATGEAWEALVTSHAIAGFTAAGSVIAAGLVIGAL